jgi:hypothetical protein
MYPFYEDERVDWEEFYLPNIPIFKSKLPPKIITRLWRYIEKSEVEFNHELAGNISKSVKLDDEENFLLKNVLNIPIRELCNYKKTNFPWYKTPTSGKHEKLILTSLWVNFQNKYEFNPLHSHSGLISFVIWLKIPTNWREQHALPFVKHSQAPAASDFCFTYTNVLGQLQDLPILMDKSSENHMIVFPAALRHQVYPFFDCDETRISISGNVAFDSSEYTKK